MEAVLVGGWGFLFFAFGLILTSRLAARAGGRSVSDLLKHRYRRQFSGPLVSSLIRFRHRRHQPGCLRPCLRRTDRRGCTDDRDLPLAVAATIWFLFVVAAAVPPRQESQPRERSA